MKRFLAALLATLAFISFSPATRADDIVDTAVSAGSFKTLAAALGAADLVGTLKGPGPFTVFAPTDEAFSKLPQGTVETLLKPENKAKLTAILTYHVVPGKVTASQVVTLPGATTVNGQRLSIDTTSGVKVNDSNVVQTDILCDNGVIHVIDTVLLPSEENIVGTASNAGTFNTLIAAAKAAGLVEPLVGDGPLTVLAPTDDAFSMLPAGTVESLLKPENKNQLASILKYHVIPGRVYSDQALNLGVAKTLEGNTVQFVTRDGQAMVAGANLVATDVDTTNGVIHIVDRVLLPPKRQASAKPAMSNVAQSDASAARATIQDAVARGSDMFNSGHHSGCASLYEQTMNNIMGMSISGSVRSGMSSCLNQARHTHTSTDRAWVLRRGLDQAYMQLGR